MSIDECEGNVSKEQVMMYPPGIPLIAPGEVWSKDLVEEVKDLQESSESHTKLLSSYHDAFEVIDTAKWRRFGLYEKRLNDYYKIKSRPQSLMVSISRLKGKNIKPLSF